MYMFSKMSLVVVFIPLKMFALLMLHLTKTLSEPFHTKSTNEFLVAANQDWHNMDILF